MRILRQTPARLFLCLCLALISGPATLLPLPAAELMTQFDTAEQEARYQELLREYRCLKCQNQNLADSQAGLASDLRREIREQILSGKTNEDIDQYLVGRYGEFVFYRPRLSNKTLLLWTGPFVLLALCLVGVYVMIRRRRTRSRDQRVADATTASGSAEELAEKLQKARDLLSS